MSKEEVQPALESLSPIRAADVACIFGPDDPGTLTDENARLRRRPTTTELIESIKEQFGDAPLTNLFWVDEVFPGHCLDGVTSDPPPTGFCKCGEKLQSKASIEAGMCTACREKQRQIGPDRPKGLA